MELTIQLFQLDFSSSLIQAKPLDVKRKKKKKSLITEFSIQ